MQTGPNSSSGLRRVTASCRVRVHPARPFGQDETPIQAYTQPGDAAGLRSFDDRTPAEPYVPEGGADLISEGDRADPARAGTLPGAQPTTATGDPGDDYRHLSAALRIGSQLLAAGASTNDVERWMERVAVAGGLLDVQSIVTMGILTMSAVRPSDGQPITQMRIVGERTADYARLAELARLVDRIDSGELTLLEASGELDRIEKMPSPYSPLFVALAGGCSSAASTLLFGGHLFDAGVTLAISLAVEPALRLVARSGLPRFFQVLLGPMFATLLAVLAASIGLPIDGQLVVAGAILRFLPGSAFVAGVRDLIDGSIISGSARLAEALLLGAAVAMGAAIAIRGAAAIGGAALALGPLPGSREGLVVQSIAAGFACAFFALTLGIRRRDVIAVWLLGAAAWAIALGSQGGGDEVVPVFGAAVMVGAGGQAVARRARMPSIIWTVPAVLPLLPGLTIVRAILALTSLNGVLAMLSAVSAGFALGAGVAFGSILVAAVRRAGMAAQNAVGPVLGEARTGIGVVIRSAERPAADLSAELRGSIGESITAPSKRNRAVRRNVPASPASNRDADAGPPPREEG
jgi:uncharacterized membrane protein YjjP (DUF1212 family)